MTIPELMDEYQIAVVPFYGKWMAGLVSDNVYMNDGGVIDGTLRCEVVADTIELAVLGVVAKIKTGDV